MGRITGGRNRTEKQFRPRTMKEPFVIGIDYGTDSVRALLANALTGEIVAGSVFNYPRWSRQAYCAPAEARFRQHPLDYLEGLRHTIREVLAARPDAAAAVRAIAIDTTASTPCLVDKKGTPLALRPEYAEDPDAMFVLWKDHTSQREAEQITALCARSEVNYARHSGNHYSAECFWAKALHLLRGSERLRRDAHAMVELCDWIPAVLTGATDPAAMAVSHCAAGSKQMWAAEWGGFPPESFFEELDPALLPIVRNINAQNHTSDHAAGTLSAQWAAELGLGTDVAVGVGNIDAHAGAVGAGISAGTVVLNLGTSACYMALMPPEKMGGRLVEGIFGQVDDSIVPGMIGFEAGLSAFGDVYAWFKRLLCYPLEEILARTETLDAATRQKLLDECRDGIMERLTADAERLALREDMPLASDWLNGRRNPYPAPELTGTITGLRLSTTAPEIYYAFAEATAFATKAILDHLTANGVETERLVGIGGISQKSPFVMQLLADITGREITVIDCKQACAMGSVVYAAVVAGCYGTVGEAQRALCNFASKTYAPTSSRRDMLLRRYERYRTLEKITQP